MTRNVIWQDHEPALQPVDETVDHVRGSAAGRLILEYGDYECPYSRQAFRAIERVEQELGGGVRFCFRHFPLTGIHPHALAAATAAEAAARQGRFWDMHAMLFHRQRALEDGDLRRLRKRELGRAMQSARQDVVDMLRRTGLPELAEEALRVLPDPVDLDFATEVLQSYGVTKDDLIDRMGGSP